MKFEEGKTTSEKVFFPKGFLWGTATSAHQVEGGNIWSDWYLFEINENVKNKEVSGKACDQYHLYQKDFDLAKKMNQNAHRLSIEWARIEKQKGKFDQDEIEHYKKVLLDLKKKGFVTFVTLHHFTNPIWMAEEGGWVNPKSVDYFLKYVEVVIKNLSPYIDFWVTINEPLVFTTHGYILGLWPPKERNLRHFFSAVKNLARANNRAYDLIHSKLPEAQVGIVHNAGPFVHFIPPLNWFLFWARNYYFLDKIKTRTDFIGVNYYFPAIWFVFGKKMISRTDLHWPIYPKGISSVVENIYKRYHKPIYITENGIADKDDHKRTKFIHDHLKYLQQSIAKGVDVRGYFHWSLIDNFEWAEGFSARFGLVEVDFKKLTRKIRESGRYFAKVCKENGLEI